MQRAWVHWRYIASTWKCLKFASVDSVKAYPANFTMSPGQPVMVSYCRHRLGLFCSQFRLGVGSRAEAQECCPEHSSGQGRHFALSLIKLYPNQRKQRAGFEDTVNFALTAGGRVKQWQPAIRDRREENKKWWRETAAAQRVHSVPLLRSLKVPCWGKETIKMFIRKNITLGIYYLLQVFISCCSWDVFQ